MQIQPVLVTAFGQIHVRSDPVLPSFDLRQPARSLSFDQSFSLALFTLASCFRNEQSPIAERANEVRQVLVRFSLEHVVDPIRRAQISDQVVGSGARRTRIPALVETNMGMILEKQS